MNSHRINMLPSGRLSSLAISLCRATATEQAGPCEALLHRLGELRISRICRDTSRDAVAQPFCCYYVPLSPSQHRRRSPADPEPRTPLRHRGRATQNPLALAAQAGPRRLQRATAGRRRGSSPLGALLNPVSPETSVAGPRNAAPAPRNRAPRGGRRRAGTLRAGFSAAADA